MSHYVATVPLAQRESAGRDTGPLGATPTRHTGKLSSRINVQNGNGFPLFFTTEPEE
jgi:hypothetical protein